ncbi:hypothetical protein P3T25_005221 [Paraburkholderia sp. GAS32]
MSDIAKNLIEAAAQSPYDAPDVWLQASDLPPPPALDWAHAAARGILEDLRGRSGVGNELEALDEDVRTELVESVADIIRTAHSAG